MKIPYTSATPRELLDNSTQGARRIHIFDHAASMALRLSLAFLPLTLLLTQLISLVGDKSLASFVSRLDDTHIMPPLVVDILKEVSENSQSIGIIQTMILAVFSAWLLSGAIRSLMHAMQELHRVKPGAESGIEHWAKSFTLALVNLLFIGVAFWLSAYQADVTDGVLEFGWDVFRWAATLLLLLFSYSFTIRHCIRKTHAYKFVSLGGLLAVFLWVCFALAYSAYYAHAGSPEEVYGRFANLCVAVLYLYYSSIVILFSAIVNVEAERATKKKKK